MQEPAISALESNNKSCKNTAQPAILPTTD